MSSQLKMLFNQYACLLGSYHIVQFRTNFNGVVIGQEEGQQEEEDRKKDESKEEEKETTEGGDKGKDKNSGM